MRKIAKSEGARVWGWLFVSLLLLGACHSVLADTNVIWDFGVPAQYSLSNPQYIEVDGTNAQLVLQAQTITHHDYTVYTNNTSDSLVEFGPDVALRMVGAPGSYPASARYISRVLDSGGGGNNWKVLKSEFANDQYDGVQFVPNVPSGGLMGWWHMDNDWIDYSGLGYNGTANGATFSVASKMGVGCGRFNGTNHYVETSGPAPSGQSASVSFWAKIDANCFNRPVYVFSTDGDALGSLSIIFTGVYDAPAWGYVSNSVGVWVNAQWQFTTCAESNSLSLVSDAGKWRHFVVTYDDLATPRVHIYKDGVDLAMYQYLSSGSIDASTKTCIGARGDKIFYYEGLLDEVAVYGRALSYSEVIELYQSGSSLRFTVRSDDDPVLLTTRVFVGPDGTTNTAYSGNGALLVSGGDFNVAHRYAQYEAKFYSDVAFLNTPYMASVEISSDDSTFVDNYLGEFSQGVFSGVTNTLLSNKGTFLGIAKQENGGYYTNANYVSRALDGGSTSALWKQIQWSLGYSNALPSSMLGLTGLYHFDGGYTKDVHGGSKFAGTAGFNASSPKLGTQSIIFNGTTQFAEYDSFGGTPGGTASVQSVQFWINDLQPNDGIMELRTTDSAVSDTFSIWISVTNRMVAIDKLKKAGPAIYINSSPVQKKLIPGWNHVALVFDYKIPVTNFVIGRSGTDYMEGSMDELAMFNRELYKSEIDDHYVKANRVAAGRVASAQARSGNTLPLTGLFTGAYANGDNVSRTNRYLQYKLVLEGDGTGTPAVETVTMFYDATSVTDDTGDEFVQGDFGGTTAYYGNNIELLNIGGPGPLPVIRGIAAGIWHMDEVSWLAGGAIVKDATSTLGNHGTPLTPNGPDTAPRAAVGSACGSFDGVNDYVSLPSISLTADFTVSGWFKTSSTNEGAVISTQGAPRWYSILVNSDGTVQAPGRVTLVVNDGMTDKLTASRTGMNDGVWHNVVCQRANGQLHIYIDGERCGSMTTAGNNDVGGSTYVGSTPTPAKYYKGYIDEVAVWDSALTEAEIGSAFSGGCQTDGQGTYVSRTLQNAGDPSIWQTLRWVPDAPYGKALTTGPVSLIGLWHFDNNYTEEVAGNDATAGAGAPGFSGAGRFDQCLTLAAADTVTAPASVDSSNITVEAWVSMNNVGVRNIVFKHDGGDGYILSTDASGIPSFRVSDTTIMGYVPIRIGKWMHIAGTYDGNKLKIYVDGDIAGVVTAPGKDASSLQGITIGNSNFAGLIDELAIHNRALNQEEIFDHYRAGAVTLKFQARAWDPGAQGFVGPDGTAATYFTDFAGVNMEAPVDLGRNFQYKAYFASEDYKCSPKLHGVSVYVANYPVGNPTVDPIASRYVPGRLLDFSNTIHRLSSNAEARYQISPNAGTTWYYWNTLTNRWLAETGSGYPLETSPDTDIQANILSFYDQIVEPTKVGVDLKFKSFLHSDGAYQIQVDDVKFRCSEGRILVTAPNGTENGTRSWIRSVPQVITWTSDGNVSSNIVIDLYDNSGATFVRTIGTNLVNTGVYTSIVHNVVGTNYRVRIWDANDLTIYDWSDNNFSLAHTYHLIAPDGGERWLVGTTNNLVWDHPTPKFDDAVDFWFSYNGLTNASAWVKVANAANVPNPAGQRNIYPWFIPTNDWRYVSENAYMAVVPFGLPNPLLGWPGGAERDFSDNAFTNAGIALMYPQLNSGIKNGNFVDVQWAAAGVGGNGVAIRLWDGVGWSVLATNVPCVPGTNNFANVQINGQTEEAVIEVKSIEHSELWGISYPFTIADINIIDPYGEVGPGSDWEVGTTNYVKWTSGGAGSNVNVKYICGELTNWVNIAANWVNTNSTTFTNYLKWVIPGPPSATYTVRVESTSQADLYAETDPNGFRICGLQLLTPLTTDEWLLTTSNRVSWLNQGGAGLVDINISYDSGATFENVASAFSQPGYNTYDIPSNTLRRPSERARIQLYQSATSKGHPFVDQMAANFLVRGIAAHSPSNGVVVNLGSNVVDALQWFSAKTLDSVVDLWYSPDNGNNYTAQIFRPGGLLFNNTDDGDSWNSYPWDISLQLKPSTNAVIKFVADTGYESKTKAFSLRGVRIVNPAIGQIVPIGSTLTVSWDYAAVFPNARGSNYVSTTGQGGPFVKGNFTTDGQLNFGGVDWDIDPTLDPTTNAVIMMDIYTPTQDMDVVAYSLPFTLAGLKMVNPSAGTNWSMNNPQTISFKSAGLGGGALGTIYYSPDGVDFDVTHPVANNYSISDGMNSYVWNIENSSAMTRLPSTSAVIRVDGNTYSATSSVFTVSGIKVTKPRLGDVWAVSDGTNYVQWRGVNAGATYDVSYTVLSGTNGTLVYPYTQVIASGIPAQPYTNVAPWAMNGNAIGDQVVITVTGGSYTNVSEVFEVVSEPSIRFSTPVNGDFLKVGSTSVVSWIQGGMMPDDFELWVTYSDNSVSQLGTSLGGEITLTNSVNLYTWKGIPNRLGVTKLLATNMSNPDIWDAVTNFSIAPTFEIEPFTANLYALKLYNAYFTTRGSVTNGVDFYYSTDISRGTNSWIHINPGAPMTVQNNERLYYPWVVNDARSSAVWLRIQDHNYPNDRFSAAKPGPYNDYGTFPISYYRVVWQVYDAVASNQLNNLSMSDNLGYSAAGLASPIVHYYPYGNWDTVWFREFFYDKAVLGWIPSENLTNSIYMERSNVEPDYNVMANFTYDANTENFIMHSWLERGGTITEGATNCTVKIYDSVGASLTNIVKDTSQNGVFWQTWNVAGLGFTQNDIFFARVEIKYSGITYSSGLTFMMRLAATPEEIGEIINVQSTFTYMQTTTNFSVYSWLEKSGVILGSASNCTVRISESGVGVDIYTDTAVSPANGVFSQNWNATGLGYDERDVFFGRTEIEYGGMKYTSGQTFMMRLAASDAITNIMSAVDSTATNVDAVRLDTGYIRGVVDGLTGSIEGMSNRLDGAISTARGDIMDAVGTNTLRLGQALTGIENVSNKLVNVIEPNVTNIMNEVRDIYTNTMSDTSRILTRPSTVQNGSTVTFLYKTRPSQPAANVKISVSPGGYNATMTEILAGMGIYERDVTFSWGSGTYIVTCSDPGGRDSMVIESVDATADDAPGMIAGVSNVLDDVMSQVTNISALVANIGGINTTDIMTGLDGIEQKLTTLRSDVSGISEIKSAVNSLDLSSLNQIDALASQVGKIGTDASDAAQSANLAKLDAKKAATGIQDLKDALDAGNAEESLKAIAEVKKAIISSQESLKALTGLIDMGGLGSKMNNMLEALKKLAEKEGFEGLIDSTEKLVGDGTQVEGMDGLNKNLNEMTGKMIHMQKLLDEAAYEPVITETLLGE